MNMIHWLGTRLANIKFHVGGANPLYIDSHLQLSAHKLPVNSLLILQ